MKKLLFTALGVNFLASPIFATENGVPAEVPTMVQFSSKEINRIVCPGQMTDLIFSEEKGMTGHFSGNNAFVKFTAEEINGKLSYPTEPSEIYAICNSSVYTIIATPTNTSAVTVRLSPPKSEVVEKNIVRYKNMPLEKQALQLIKEAYTGDFPSSYRVRDEVKPIALCADLMVEQKQLVEIDGVGLKLKIFEVTSTRTDDLDLEEKTFLNTDIGTHIIALAVLEHHLGPHESTQIFVVEKKEARKTSPVAASLSQSLN